MKLALIIIVSLVVVVVLAVVLIALIGWRLPSQHSATRSIVLHKTPESVYAVTRDFASMPKWRADVREVTVTIEPNGRVHFR